MNNLNLITDRLAEIIGMDELVKITNNRPLKIYWGTAPTGKIHIGYLIPLLKIADFLDAGCTVKILIADLHAVLDNMKSTPEQVKYRTSYYQEMITCILKNLNVPLDNLEFIYGSTFQTQPKYTMDVYKLMTMTSIKDAKKAGSEVVKQSDNPQLSGVVYPLLQALDEEYLDVDAQFGGIDQRKIFTYAQESLPFIGYKKRIHLMNPMMTSISATPSETGTKMSSSDTNSKIDMLDEKNAIKKKINSAYCLEGDISFNPVMDLTQNIIFPLLSRLKLPSFTIPRPEKYGGSIIYTDFHQLQLDFIEKKLHPQDLKVGVIQVINDFIDPISSHFKTVSLKEIIKKAYD